ncbi:methyltransferase domain-containing protein [Terrimonas pollutisoli]|uniref:methyltransferase domain-containing protein n=1 Tax=Terrimonas pollutisoli TaxID=3034147 RepID=UPI0023EB32E2|nr:methyltransferase domain-containing protein [Terrimonas sp. H1YJ31]
MNSYRLLLCNESPHNGRVYFVLGNCRRWIPSGTHMDSYGFKWEDIETVSAEYIDLFELSAPLALPGIQYTPDLLVGAIRDHIGSQLSGSGIEFGAASNPFPCSIHAIIEYADFFDNFSEDSPYFNNNTYTNEFVRCKYQTGIEDMSGIADQSKDFLILCHVIEHVRNPLLAIEKAWTKLKPNGNLVLLVPHKELTFDSARDLTTLDHLILDYKRPLRERDFLHFVEFYEKAFVSANPYKRAVTEFNNKYSDIHYHTWNEDSFLEMVNYFSKNIKPWSSIVYYPHSVEKSANEFYFILQK